MTNNNEQLISLKEIPNYLEGLEYDNFSGTYWQYCEEEEEHIEFTEDDLIKEGIYLNEFCQQI